MIEDSYITSPCRLQVGCQFFLSQLTWPKVFSRHVVNKLNHQSPFRMCMFSRPVISVSATNIFARAGEGDLQYLVYSMTIKAKEALAMVLPLPAKNGTDEKSLNFIDLKRYPDFFADLGKGFPALPAWEGAAHPNPSSATLSAMKLEVVQVGEFEASFVPTVKDFPRLDERFRLPADTWKKLREYQSYGFAVFKLKPGAATIHPMAFSFPRRNPKQLFFPTVHIHDGKVHAKAHFDHALYCQPSEQASLPIYNWAESYTHPARFMQVDKAKGLIVPDQHCYRQKMRGLLANRDTFLSTTA